MRVIGILVVTMAAFFMIGTSPLDAKRHHYKKVADANGNVATGLVRTSTGATTRVSAKYASQFQGYIDDLEKNYGATIKDIGGNRRGHCSPRHMHSCGRAIDVCQLRRGVVRSDCHLPPRATLARIAKEHGIFEGGLWCNHDYGHAQIGVSAPACGERTLVAKRHTVKHHRYAQHRKHRRQYAQVTPRYQSFAQPTWSNY